MKILKARQMYFWLISFLSIFLLTGCGGGGGGGGVAAPETSTSKAITSYSFLGLPGNSGTINEAAKTITVIVPNGTDRTALVPVLATTGANVTASATIFTSPVTYTVTAADNSTVDYTVTVVPASLTDKAITAYSFAGLPGAAGTINAAAKTIAVTVPFGTDLTARVANFTSTGARVEATFGAVIQTSGATPNNFTSPVVYTVFAADNSSTSYTVTVTVAPITAKAVTAFSFAGFGGAAGTINTTTKNIAVTVPFGTDVTTLIPKFTTTGTIVKIGSTVQTSDATTVDFTNPVVYTFIAADNSTATYTVTVTVAPITAKAVTAFSFTGLGGSTGTINATAKTIAVTVPAGTDVTSLVATFISTGTVVKVGTAIQTSAVTANNFTSPVNYTFTAADASTTTYAVTVTVASGTAKAITAYSFAGFSGAAGTINATAKTITVTVPSGTDVTSLVATFTTTGTSVKVGAAVQTSAATANDFTSPVAYTVFANDTSTATYTVTVTAASATAKAITAFSFAGFSGATGAIDATAKTIAVTVPSGTDVTDLVATFTTTGAGVKIGAAVQTSAATANDFTSPVAYTVTASDNSTATYTVTVTAAPATAKAITAFSFAGFSGAAGVISEGAKTIAVTVPFGTDPTDLVATFTITGTIVKVGATVQTSAATANDFTSPVAYIVTAANDSTATYTVTVTVAGNSAQAITAFSFAGFSDSVGTIDDGTKAIAVTVPPGTDLTDLIASFTSTGTMVKVGATVQTSTATANDFTSPVVYTVIANDTSSTTYTVTVSTGLGLAPVLLGTAGNFVILTKAGITDVPSSAITGNIGTSPISGAFIGVTCPEVTGTIYTVDAAGPACKMTNGTLLTTAIGDMETAYTDAAGRPAGVGPFLNVGAGTVAGQTLIAGVYTWSSNVVITTDLTLSGGPNDVWIFQITGTLNASPGVKVLLSGGAKAKNIFWQLSGAATLDTGSHFEGTILTQTKVALNTGASINGRLLAQTEVTLQQNAVTQPTP